jgi:hypothetical protein
LRAALQSRYDAHARSVGRLLSERAELRASGDADEAIVTDLVAVRAYIAELAGELDPGLRSAASPANPVVGCVVSGLRRLASYRGPAFRGGVLAPGQVAAYRPGAVLIERAFLRCTVNRAAGLPGNAEYLIWSATGRRVTGLDVPDETSLVVFAANLQFKLLAVTGASGGRPIRVYLRELPTSRHNETSPHLTDDDQMMLARLRDALTDRDAIPPARRPSFGDPAAPGFPLGLDADDQPFPLPS